MSILTRIRDAWQPAEARGYNVLESLLAPRNASGFAVTPETATRVAAVYACVRVISEGLAQLPLDVYSRNADDSRKLENTLPIHRLLHDMPNTWQTSFEFREQMMLHLLLKGNAVARIKTYRGQLELLPIHPARITYEVTEAGKMVYLVRDERTGTTEKLMQGEVLHVRGPSSDGIIGTTPITSIANIIGASMAADTHSAATWKNGARPGIVLQTDQNLPQNAANRMREDWERLYGGASNSGKTAVLESGLKVHEIGLNHTDMQFIEQQKMNATQIASVFRVPQHMIGILDHATFSNIEHQQLEFVKFTLVPWMERWEQAIQRDLIDDDRYYAEFNVEGLLRGDTASRATFYREMFNIGVLSVNEIRRFENFNPVDCGDSHFVNSALTTLERAEEGPAEAVPATPAMPTTEPVVDAATDPTEEQQAAARSVWSDQVNAMVRWQCDALVRAAKKPSTFLAECQAFADEHQARMVSKLAIPERVCRSVGVNVSAAVHAAEHRANTWAMILKASEATAAELPTRVDLLCERLKNGAK